jgi:hypothetical protein
MSHGTGRDSCVHAADDAERKAARCGSAPDWEQTPTWPPHAPMTFEKTAR